MLPPIKILQSAHEIDNAVSLITNSITTAVLESTPKRPLLTQKFSKPPLPKYIQNLIKEKNRIRRLWNEHRLPYLKSELNRLIRVCRQTLQDYNFEQYKNYVSSLSSHNSSVWLATRKLLRKKTTIPPLLSNGQKVFSQNDKAELLADFYATTFQPHNVEDPPHSNEVNAFVSLPNFDVPNRVKFASPTEVYNIIKNLPRRKSPGHENISPIMLKNLPRNAVAFITNIINSMFRLGYFPKLWKHSIVVPIPKPEKNQTLPSSYRPISLLPILAKTAEKVILKRLNSFLKNPRSFLITNLVLYLNILLVINFSD